MILDIDHLALSALDFKSTIKFFKQFNYNMLFYETKIANPKIKKKFMKHFSINHDLYLLNSKSNLNIELLK